MSLSKHFCGILSASLCTLMLSMTSCQEKGNKEQCSLIPQPNELKTNTGHFAFNNSTVFYVSPELDKNSTPIIESFSENLNTVSGFQTAVQPLNETETLSKQSIVFKTNEKIAPEGYELNIQPDEIMIQASDRSGVFYALQTLKQLLPVAIYGNEPVADTQWTLPCVEIKDAPRFGYRGLHIDVARHFFPKEEMKKILDLMALHKQNQLHWHLTDDQGWRIEIKKYPKLTEIGAFRDSTQIGGFNSTKYDPNPHGGFYTQDDIREIVAYATARHINIIPEIEIPGHASASIAAYPWLGTTGKQIKVSCRFGVHHEVYNVANPKVFDFLDDVIDEMIQLFPGEIFHIGGDEVRYNHWKESEETRKFMEEKGIQTYPELQVWITNLMSEKLKAKGRRMMGWNEITGVQLHDYQQEKVQKQEQKLSEGTIVQIWKGSPELIKATAEQGYDILNSYNRYTYLDYDYNTIPLEKAYTFNPIPTDLPKSLKSKILGVGCQMWGEFIPTVKEMNLKVYPRIAAYAEVGWTRPDQKDFKRFTQSLQKLKAIWKKEGIEYYETPQAKK